MLGMKRIDILICDLTTINWRMTMKCEECFSEHNVSWSDHYSKDLCLDCYNEMSEAEDRMEMENDYEA